jgi:undecaprenyl-diphosphatase
MSVSRPTTSARAPLGAPFAPADAAGRAEWLARLDAHDRAILATLVAGPRTAAECRLWRFVTHLGGAMATTLLCLAPLVLGDATWRVGVATAAIVLLSHALVQLVKRTVGRPRPELRAGTAALVLAPDRFSFPSGHATAAMAVALGYAMGAPALLPVLALGAMLVGLSRVVLGVHYLGDVLAGQLLAVVSALVVRAAGLA